MEQSVLMSNTSVNPNNSTSVSKLTTGRLTTSQVPNYLTSSITTSWTITSLTKLNNSDRMNATAHINSTIRTLNLLMHLDNTTTIVIVVCVANVILFIITILIVVCIRVSKKQENSKKYRKTTDMLEKRRRRAMLDLHNLSIHTTESEATSAGHGTPTVTATITIIDDDISKATISHNSSHNSSHKNDKSSTSLQLMVNDLFRVSSTSPTPYINGETPIPENKIDDNDDTYDNDNTDARLEGETDGEETQDLQEMDWKLDENFGDEPIRFKSDSIVEAARHSHKSTMDRRNKDYHEFRQRLQNQVFIENDLLMQDIFTTIETKV